MKKLISEATIINMLVLTIFNFSCTSENSSTYNPQNPPNLTHSSEPVHIVPHSLSEDEVAILNLSFQSKYTTVIANETIFFGTTKHAIESEAHYIQNTLRSSDFIYSEEALQDCIEKSQNILLVENRPDNLIPNVVFYNSVKNEVEALSGGSLNCLFISDVVPNFGEYCAISPIGFNAEMTQAIMFLSISACPGGFSLALCFYKENETWKMHNDTFMTGFSM